MKKAKKVIVRRLTNIRSFANAQARNLHIRFAKVRLEERKRCRYAYFKFLICHPKITRIFGVGVDCIVMHTVEQGEK
jgi:hypothetical protein